MSKAFGVAIEEIDAAALGTDQQIAPAVLKDGADELRRQALRIVRLPTIHGEFIAVEFIQAVIRPEPEKTSVILIDGIYLAVGEAVLNRKMLEFQLIELRTKLAWERKKRQ